LTSDGSIISASNLPNESDCSLSAVSNLSLGFAHVEAESGLSISRNKRMKLVDMETNISLWKASRSNN